MAPERKISGIMARLTTVWNVSSDRMVTAKSSPSAVNSRAIRQQSNPNHTRWRP